LFIDYEWNVVRLYRTSKSTTKFDGMTVGAHSARLHYPHPCTPSNLSAERERWRTLLAAAREFAAGPADRMHGRQRRRTDGSAGGLRALPGPARPVWRAPCQRNTDDTDGDVAPRACWRAYS